MSDYSAIGAVSDTLKALLEDRMEIDILPSPLILSIGPPPERRTAAVEEHPQVNLFLYRVSENASLQNQESPGRGSRGAFGRPPLSLNLHYLLTAYAATVTNGEAPGYDHSLSQKVLGSAMRVLHDYPVVTDRLTRQRAMPGAPLRDPALLDVALRGDYESIKTTLEPLSLEDLTKIWTSLSLPIRLSAAYVVQVVQIESLGTRTFPRPVGQPATVDPIQPRSLNDPGPWVKVITISTPTITDLRVRRGTSTVEQSQPYARIGDTLVLRGTHLSGLATSVSIGNLLVPASVARADRVEVLIPNDATLQPGILALRVLTSDPTVPGAGVASNQIALMLVPLIETVTPAPALAAVNGLLSSIEILGTRLWQATHSGEAVIGHEVVPSANYLGKRQDCLELAIPNGLPSGVQVLVSEQLTFPITVGATSSSFTVSIAGVSRQSAQTMETTLDSTTICDVVAGMIRGAGPTEPAFRDVKVELFDGRLFVIAGGSHDAMNISASGAASPQFADKIGFPAGLVQLAGAATALLSGSLPWPPVLSSTAPQVTLRSSSTPALHVLEPGLPTGADQATWMADLATRLKTKINAATGNQVMVVPFGNQLLFISDVAECLWFEALATDLQTVSDLRLRMNCAVRVRVNGAESIDDVQVVLPR